MKYNEGCFHMFASLCAHLHSGAVAKHITCHLCIASTHLKSSFTCCCIQRNWHVILQLIIMSFSCRALTAIYWLHQSKRAFSKLPCSQGNIYIWCSRLKETPHNFPRPQLRCNQFVATVQSVPISADRTRQKNRFKACWHHAKWRHVIKI